MAQVNAYEIIRRRDDVDNVVSVYAVDGATASATDRDIVAAILDAMYDGAAFAPVTFNAGGWYDLAAYDGGALYCFPVDDAAIADARRSGVVELAGYEFGGGVDEWNELFPDYQI